MINIEYLDKIYSARERIKKELEILESRKEGPHTQSCKRCGSDSFADLNAAIDNKKKTLALIDSLKLDYLKAHIKQE